MSQQEFRPLGAYQFPPLVVEEIALRIDDDETMFSWCRLNIGSCRGPTFWKERIRRKYGSDIISAINRSHGLNYDVWYISKEKTIIDKIASMLQENPSFYDNSDFWVQLEESLSEFVRAGCISIVEYLRQYANYFIIDKGGFIPGPYYYSNGKWVVGQQYLYDAAKGGKFEMVKMIIEDNEKYGNRKIRTSNVSPVRSALANKNDDIAAYLIEKMPSDPSWLEDSARMGNVAIFKLAVDKLQFNIIADGDKIFYSALSGGVPIVKYIIDSGYVPHEPYIMIAYVLKHSKDDELLRYLRDIVGLPITDELLNITPSDDMIQTYFPPRIQ